MTIRREDAVQRWPVEKKAPLTAHSTATFRSASSSTTSGFLPPISSCTFFIGVEATAGSRDLAARRDRTGEGDRVRRPDASAACRRSPTPRPMTRLNTPAGRPARDDDVGQGAGGARHEIGRLEHHAIAVGERRGDLPGRDRDREVPRRDQRDDADRLARDLDLDAGPDVAVFSPARRNALAGEEREDLAGARRPRQCLRAASCPPRATAGGRVRPCGRGSRPKLESDDLIVLVC